MECSRRDAISLPRSCKGLLLPCSHAAGPFALGKADVMSREHWKDPRSEWRKAEFHPPRVGEVGNQSSHPANLIPVCDSSWKGDPPAQEHLPLAAVCQYFDPSLGGEPKSQTPSPVASLEKQVRDNKHLSHYVWGEFVMWSKIAEDTVLLFNPLKWKKKKKTQYDIIRAVFCLQLFTFYSHSFGSHKSHPECSESLSLLFLPSVHVWKVDIYYLHVNAWV